MRELPELVDDLTLLEIELLAALETAAALIRDFGYEELRQKRLQPVIDKACKFREDARHEVWKAVK